MYCAVCIYFGTGLTPKVDLSFLFKFLILENAICPLCFKRKLNDEMHFAKKIRSFEKQKYISAFSLPEASTKEPKLHCKWKLS